MFVWRDCATGKWLVRVTAGGAAKAVNYTGSVKADAAFTSVVNFSIESLYDIVAVGTSPPAINFVMNVSNAVPGWFQLYAADHCLRLHQPEQADESNGAGGSHHDPGDPAFPAGYARLPAHRPDCQRQDTGHRRYVFDTALTVKLIAAGSWCLAGGGNPTDVTGAGSTDTTTDELVIYWGTPGVSRWRDVEQAMQEV